jgi:putative copper resistance protein D
MIEPAIVVVRLLQYLGATVLFGSSLFFIYGAPAPPRWGRALVAGAAALLAAAALLSVAAQAILFAGSLAAGLTGEAMGAVVSSMDLGKAAVVRALAAASAAVLVLALPPSRASWSAAAALGAIATASLAWMGHGAASEGPLGAIHLTSDIIHALAAAVWIGALACFLLLLADPSPSAEHQAALHAALRRFSGLGSVVVALLVLTGLINGWILVGPDNLVALWTSPYGRLLAAKVALFGAMLGLAAVNRYRLTPALGSADPDAAIGALRRSVGLETAAALTILALVAWLGTLAPPTAA